MTQPNPRSATNVFADNDTLTRAQVATELGVTTDTVAQYERDGMPVIKLRKLNLYHVPTILKWLLKYQTQQGRKQ